MSDQDQKNQVRLNKERFKGLKMTSEEAYGTYPWMCLRFSTIDIHFPINQEELEILKQRISEIEIHSGRYFDEREEREIIERLEKEEGEERRLFSMYLGVLKGTGLPNNEKEGSE